MTRINLAFIAVWQKISSVAWICSALIHMYTSFHLHISVALISATGRASAVGLQNAAYLHNIMWYNPHNIIHGHAHTFSRRIIKIGRTAMSYKMHIISFYWHSLHRLDNWSDYGTTMEFVLHTPPFKYLTVAHRRLDIGHRERSRHIMHERQHHALLPLVLSLIAETTTNCTVTSTLKHACKRAYTNFLSHRYVNRTAH